MLNNRPILLFVVIFLASYFILVGLGSTVFVQKGLHSVYRGISKTSMQSLLPNLKINTKPEQKGGTIDHNKMVLEFQWSDAKVEAAIAHARKNRIADLQVPYRFIFYFLFQFFTVPLAFLLSLILATPMKWRKKVIWGSLSIFVMLILLLCKMYLQTLYSVSTSAIQTYQYSHEINMRLQWIASLWSMGLSIVLALFLWLIFIFRNSRLRSFIEDFFDKNFG